MKSPIPFILVLSSLALAACDTTVESEAKYPTGADRRNTDQNKIYEKPESIFGGDGLNVFGGKSDDNKGGSGITVNSFLWRAALDTVSFMPLASADPFGGTILTDWYSSPGVNNERFKLNVFILDQQLRSDGVRVKAFKQVLKKGNWVDADMGPETARNLEDTILTRARQLRIAQSGQ